MHRFLFILLTIGLICSCNNSTKNQSADNNQIQKSTQKTEPNRGKENYLEIKKQFDQGYYVDLNRRISQFYEYDKESIFLDSVKLIEKEFLANLNNLKKTRDSLSQLPLTDYVNGLNLPRLDSITSKNFEIIEHSYLRDFTDFDKSLFKTDWEINWYLSKQLSDSLICLTACHFRDCENLVVLYSLDSNNKIIDSKELYDNGCYAEPAPDFRYEKYLVNEQNRFNASYFHGDNAFTRISRTYFTLRDTITDNVLVEIGDELNVTYRMDSLGIFKVVEDKSFQKEYVEPLYNVPI